MGVKEDLVALLEEAEATKDDDFTVARLYVMVAYRTELQIEYG